MQQTAVALLPGQQTELSWTVPFPIGSPGLDFYVQVDDGEKAGIVAECDESNNFADAASVSCPMPG